MTSLTRIETDQLRRLEEMRKALSELGTDDAAEIQKLIEEAQARNAKLAEEFGTALRDVEARLRQLGDER
jgi:hypothetical protein